MFKDRYDERQFTHGPDWIKARYGKNIKPFRANLENQIEGWAAAAVAVAAVGASAYSAYSQSSAQQAQAAALSKQPGVVAYTPVDPSASFSNYETYRNSVLPQAQQDAVASNTFNNQAYQTQLSNTSPSLMSGIAQQGNVANNLLNGVIPQDVQDNVTRSSAYQALSGGFSGSGASNALTARDLGLTSLQLEQQGSTMLGQNAALTGTVNPFNQTGDSNIMNSSQYLARDDSNTAYANAVLNRNKQIQYQNSIYATQANNINPLANAAVSGVGSLASMYFGGGGNALNGMMNGGGSNLYGASQQTAASGYYNPYLDPSMYNNAGSYIGG